MKDSNLYQTLTDICQRYFEAVKQQDLTLLLSFFDANASFHVHAAAQGDPATWGSIAEFKTKKEIETLYQEFFASIKETIICRPEHVVIDEKQRHFVTEQRYVARTHTGDIISLYNCSSFSLNESNLIVRIMNWSANEPYEINSDN